MRLRWEMRGAMGTLLLGPTGLPLPEGEGRGEGERDIRMLLTAKHQVAEAPVVLVDKNYHKDQVLYMNRVLFSICTNSKI